jgi:hypothetical protein
MYLLICRAIDFRAAITRSSSASDADARVVPFVPPNDSDEAAVTRFVLRAVETTLSPSFPRSTLMLPEAFVLMSAGGITLPTNLSINWSMRCSPSCFRKLLVMLMTTASIGIKANSVA